MFEQEMELLRIFGILVLMAFLFLVPVLHDYLYHNSRKSYFEWRNLSEAWKESHPDEKSLFDRLKSKLRGLKGKLKL